MLPRSAPHLFALAVLALLAVAPAQAQIRIGGFTDLYFWGNDDEIAGSRSGFREGQFVLHLSSTMSPRIAFFSEITWSPGATSFSTEIERAIVTYRHNDWFKPSAGRFHTPVSWWNSAFHHGAWLQTSVDRPIPVKFGSHFTPVHFVGVMLDGTVFPGGLSLGYSAGVGNGRGENVGRAGDAGDVNNHRALLGRIVARHDALYALQVGGAVYLDRFEVQSDDSSLDETMLSAFVVYSSESPELLAEVFRIEHEDPLTGETAESISYYAQLGWRLPMWNEIAKPYARIEDMAIDEADRGFSGDVLDVHRLLGGVRLDVASKVALKLEFRRIREGAPEYVNEYFSSVCLTF